MALQEACAGGANLMRHCRQCRADAVGLLGEDRGQEFTLDQIPQEVAYDPSVRTTYREVVARERQDHVAAKQEATVVLDETDSDARILVAVATKGGGRVNQHFGHAKEFQVYEASAAGVRFIGHRKVEDAYCKGGFGEDATLDSVLKTLEGVDTVLCAKIGDCPQGQLKSAGITATDAYAFEYIETAISACYADRYGRPVQAQVA
jgi:nitrogen fixation protein NifB